VNRYEWKDCAGGEWESRRAQKCVLPQIDVGFPGVESDASEEMLSHPINPQIGDDATRIEHCQFVT
jgi:hypothetical protein